jgi:hypothetical protein
MTTQGILLLVNEPFTGLRSSKSVHANCWYRCFMASRSSDEEAAVGSS